MISGPIVAKLRCACTSAVLNLESSEREEVVGGLLLSICADSECSKELRLDQILEMTGW